MSLINEALRKARLEAARQEAADSGIPYPAREGEHPRRAASLVWLAAAALGLVLVAATGGLLFWLGQRSAGEDVQVAERSPEITAGANAVEGAGTGSTAAESTRESVSESVPKSVPKNVPIPRAANDPATATSVDPGDLLTSAKTPAVAEPVSQPANPEPEPAANRRQPAAPVATPLPNASEPVAQTVAPAATPPTIPEDPVGQPIATPRGEPERSATPEPLEKIEAPRPVTTDPDQEPSVQAPPERVFVGEAEVAGGVVRLEGIAWSRDRPFALINGRVVGTGDHIESLTITKVERRRILLQDDGGSTYVLQLR